MIDEIAYVSLGLHAGRHLICSAEISDSGKESMSAMLAHPSGFPVPNQMEFSGRHPRYKKKKKYSEKQEGMCAMLAFQFFFFVF